MISSEQIHLYNSQGLFPFPGETQQVFLERVKRVQSEHATIHPKEIPLTEEYRQEALQLCSIYYGLFPAWAKVACISKEQFHFFEGGFAYFTNGQSSVYLRPEFLFREKLWGLYARTEILLHEFIHICRIPGFTISIYEEILAYTSSKGFRKFFGPISYFRKTLIGFCCGVTLSCVVNLLSLFWSFPFLAILSTCLFVFGWFIFLIATAQLVKHQYLFYKALKKLNIATQGNGIKLMMRLAPSEIEACAIIGPKKIQEFFKNNSTNTSEGFRYDFLYTCYFSS